jgi:hypothetical protein
MHISKKKREERINRKLRITRKDDRKRKPGHAKSLELLLLSIYTVA